MNCWWRFIRGGVGWDCGGITPRGPRGLLINGEGLLFLTLITISPLRGILRIHLGSGVLLLRRNPIVDFLMLVFIQEEVELTRKSRKNRTDTLFIILPIFPHLFAWSKSTPYCMFSSFYFYGLTLEFWSFLLPEKNHDLVEVLEHAGWASKLLLYHEVSTLEVWSFF